MNAFLRRAFQKIMFVGSYALPWREPKILHSNADLINLLKDKNIHSVLLVTDPTISQLGLTQSLQDALAEGRIDVGVYDKTVANPTIDNVEEALELYKRFGAQSVIGFGGGSSIDCAKGVAARVARPKKSVLQMKGLFKILRRTPLTVAVPTTSGTGSETTVAAVITDAKTHHKYPINDISLVPHYALLDPALTIGLPPFVTATTGMDALTHAVEAYIGHSNTRKTAEAARDATQLIFENLERAYVEGSDAAARSNMQHASYLAGVAFTRAYVGNVHAISHAISGMYGLAHGLTNAVALPLILDYYVARGKAIKPLDELAQLVGLKDARSFIDEVYVMNERMGIPRTLEGLLEKDYDFLATAACKEANPLYPVPVIFNKSDFTEILKELAG